MSVELGLFFRLAEARTRLSLRMLSFSWLAPQLAGLRFFGGGTGPQAAKFGRDVRCIKFEHCYDIRARTKLETVGINVLMEKRKDRLSRRAWR